MPFRKLSIIIALVLTAVLCVFAFDTRIITRTYSVETDKMTKPLRFALVTDLHSCRYGDGQTKLIEAVISKSPDMVLLGGDIFDDDMPNVNAELFIAAIAGEYPCYYVTGNHEYWAGAEAFHEQMRVLEKYGVRILSGECETITVNGQPVSICGVDDPAIDRAEGRRIFLEQLDRVGAAEKDGAFALLLAHRPEFAETYAAYDFDLTLCGHAHGGQWRIPGILNGLYAPDQGLFPKYAGGMYALDHMTMIVSRGLARESTRVPRIFNRPELVIVEITPG